MCLNEHGFICPQDVSIFLSHVCALKKKTKKKTGHTFTPSFALSNYYQCREPRQIRGLLILVLSDSLSEIIYFLISSHTILLLLIIISSRWKPPNCFSMSERYLHSKLYPSVFISFTFHWIKLLYFHLISNQFAFPAQMIMQIFCLQCQNCCIQDVKNIKTDKSCCYCSR